MNSVARIKHLILESEKVCLLTGTRVDYDCLSSAILFSDFLDENKIEYDIFSNSLIPSRYQDIYGIDRVQFRHSEKIDFNRYDLIITFDSGNLQSFVSVPLEDSKIKGCTGKILNIDHHSENEKFTDLLIFYPDISSTLEILYIHGFLNLDRFTKQMAELAYLAIIQETNNFRFSFSASTFEFAGRLLGKGIDVQKLLYKSYYNRSSASLRVENFAFLKTEIDPLLRTGFMFAEDQEFRKLGASDEEITEALLFYAEGFVRANKEIDRGFYIRTIGDKIKGSARGNNYTNTVDLPKVLKVSKINGGGHFQACGFTIKISDLLLESGVSTILDGFEYLREKISKGLSLLLSSDVHQNTNNSKKYIRKTPAQSLFKTAVESSIRME
jgi:bifunctional oligoribonuclease and PAP phosphatase NrnA